MSSWQPRCALVTGASSGIGRGVALELVRRGLHVVAAARRKDRLDALAVEAGNRLTPVTLDITDAGAVAALPAQLRALSLRPDVLVNNAGYGRIGPVEDIELDDLRAQFETNVFAIIALLHAFLPGMRSERRGRIVNVSSVSGLIGLPFMGVYTASKFALEGLSDSLRLELSPFGIDVALVEPAAISSEFSSAAGAISSATQARTDAYVDLFRAERMRAASDAQAAPEKVAVEAIVQAVCAAKPLARRVVPRRGRTMVSMRRLLGDQRFDALLLKRFGLNSVRSLE